MVFGSPGSWVLVLCADLSCLVRGKQGLFLDFLALELTRVSVNALLCWRKRFSAFLEARKVWASFWGVQPLGSWRSEITIHLPSCWSAAI